MIHRRENGSVAWSATIRYALATVCPLFVLLDRASGRAYTRLERHLYMRCPTVRRWM